MLCHRCGGHGTVTYQYRLLGTDKWGEPAIKDCPVCLGLGQFSKPERKARADGYIGVISKKSFEQALEELEMEESNGSTD